MTKAPSLLLRVVALLALAQLPAFLITWLLLDTINLFERFDVEDLYFHPDEMAIDRTGVLVAESLIRDHDGSIRIEPTPALRSEMRRASGLQFVAYDPVQWTPFAGSSEKLTSRLSGVVQTRPRHLHFMMKDTAKNDVQTNEYDGHLAFVRTESVYAPIALTGYKFEWKDLFEFYPMDWTFMFASIVVAVLVTTATAWFAVRRGLQPLADLAKKVEQIEMNSLHQRLSTSGVPAEIRGLVDVFNDALKRLQSGAEKQRRFAANAAHELRTPLAILRARVDNAKASTFKSELLGDANRLRSIVEQMLISSRIAEGQAALDERVDLDKTLRRLIAEILPLAFDRDRSLEYESAPSALITRGNQRAIESVVTNLLDNALREEPKGGTVYVRTDDEGVIAVIDHGQGVPCADREMIFERFWRRSPSSAGAGLGLAIAKDIVDAHGGRIWVEETPGGGATFKLSFPGLESS